ncbi:MAG: hypothetical protein ACPG5O_04080 [Pseudoalteromonas tetraodonis]
MMNKITRSKIRKALPHGSIKTIAEKFEISRATVTNVLNGIQENSEVMEEAIAIVKAKKQADKKLEAKAKNALNAK